MARSPSLDSEASSEPPSPKNHRSSIDIAQKVITSYHDSDKTLWDTFKAFEEAFTTEWKRGLHDTSTFQDWAEAHIPRPIILAIFEVHLTSMHENLTARHKGYIERFHTSLDLRLWEAYFMFGIQTFQSRDVLEGLVRITKIWPDLGAIQLLHTLEESRQERIAKKSKRGQKRDMSNFLLADIKAAERKVQAAEDQKIPKRAERRRARLALTKTQSATSQAPSIEESRLTNSTNTTNQVQTNDQFDLISGADHKGQIYDNTQSATSGDEDASQPRVSSLSAASSTGEKGSQNTSRSGSIDNTGQRHVQSSRPHPASPREVVLDPDSSIASVELPRKCPSGQGNSERYEEDSMLLDNSHERRLSGKFDDSGSIDKEDWESGDFEDYPAMGQVDVSDDLGEEEGLIDRRIEKDNHPDDAARSLSPTIITKDAYNRDRLAWAESDIAGAMILSELSSSPFNYKFQASSTSASDTHQTPLAGNISRSQSGAKSPIPSSAKHENPSSPVSDSSRESRKSVAFFLSKNVVTARRGGAAKQVKQHGPEELLRNEEPKISEGVNQQLTRPAEVVSMEEEEEEGAKEINPTEAEDFNPLVLKKTDERIVDRHSEVRLRREFDSTSTPINSTGSGLPGIPVLPTAVSNLLPADDSCDMSKIRSELGVFHAPLSISDPNGLHDSRDVQAKVALPCVATDPRLFALDESNRHNTDDNASPNADQPGTGMPSSPKSDHHTNLPTDLSTPSLVENTKPSNTDPEPGNSRQLPPKTRSLKAWKDSRIQHPSTVSQWSITLGGRHMLRDDLVYFLSCSATCSPDVLVLQPLYIAMGDCVTFAKYPERFLRYRLIVIPLHHPEALHYTLAVVDVKGQEMRHFDSIASRARFRDVQRHVLPWMAGVFADVDPEAGEMRLRSKSIDCQQQTDSVSCGLIVANWAKAVSEGVDIERETAYDVHVLRNDALARVREVTHNISKALYKTRKRPEIVDLEDAQPSKVVATSPSQSATQESHQSLGTDTKLDTIASPSRPANHETHQTLDAEPDLDKHIPLTQSAFQETKHTPDTVPEPDNNPSLTQSATHDIHQRLDVNLQALATAVLVTHEQGKLDEDLEDKETLDKVQSLMVQSSNLLSHYYSRKEEKIVELEKSIHNDVETQAKIAEDLSPIRKSVKRLLEEHSLIAESTGSKRAKISHMKEHLGRVEEERERIFNTMGEDCFSPVREGEMVMMRRLESNLQQEQEQEAEVLIRLEAAKEAQKEKESEIDKCRKKLDRMGSEVQVRKRLLKEALRPAVDSKAALGSLVAFREG